MHHFWLYLSNFGVTPERSYEKNRKVRLQNQVAALISALGCIFVFINIFSSRVPLAIAEATVIASLLNSIVLNRKRKYMFSTLLLYASLEVMVILLCFLFSPKRDHEYLLLLFGVLQVFFFDSRTVRNTLLVVSFLLFVSAKIFAYGIQDAVMYLNYSFTFLLAFFTSRYLKIEFDGYRKVIESQNLQLKKLNAENEQLISITSHDLRSPLARVQGVLDLLATTTHVTKAQHDLLRLAENEVQQQISVISDALDLRAITESAGNIRLEHIDTLTVIKDLLAGFQPIAAKKNITLLLQHEYDGYFCLCHSGYLKKVAENLISNALKFSYENTHISISFSTMDETLSISFRDHGPGIDERDMSRLYMRFQRLSAAPTGGENSSGLGLSIAKKYTEAMNGSIACKSEKGKGATFIINLPWSPTATMHQISAEPMRQGLQTDAA